jgi:hypothetical protein
MKNQQHYLVPLILAVVAIVVGVTTLAVNYSQPSGGPVAVGSAPTTKMPLRTAVVSVTSVSADTASAGDAGSRIVSWKTTDFPKNATVTINLLRKVSDNPASYEFVAPIAVDTANDGTESWTPSSEEGEGDFYIEVVCGSNISGGCRSGSAPAKAY